MVQLWKLLWWPLGKVASVRRNGCAIEIYLLWQAGLQTITNRQDCCRTLNLNSNWTEHWTVKSTERNSTVKWRDIDNIWNWKIKYSLLNISKYKIDILCFINMLTFWNEYLFLNVERQFLRFVDRPCANTKLGLNRRTSVIRPFNLSNYIIMFFSGEVLTIFALLLTPVLYEISRGFRYYFKFFTYYFIVMFISVLVIPVMLWKPRDVKNLL